MSNTYTFRGYFTETDLIYPKYLSEENMSKKWLFLITHFTLESGEQIKLKWTFNWLPNGFIEVETSEEVSQYGSTYNVIAYRHYIPQDSQGVNLYLKKFFKLSDRQADKIYNLFDWVDVLSKLVPEMDKILQLKGLFTKKEKYDQFKNLCLSHMEWSEVRYFLYEYGVNERQVKETILKFWQSSLDKIKENPYNLLKVSWIWFKTADSVFLQFGFDRKDERRILASLYYVIQEFCDKKKSLFIYETELLHSVNSYLSLNTYDVQISLEQLQWYVNRRHLWSNTYDERLDSTIYKDLKVVSFAWMTTRLVFIYQYYEWETETAHRIKSALKSKDVTTYQVSEQELENWDKPLNEQQKEAIRNCFNHKLSIIRGYGGTWKSTIIKKIIEKCKKEGLTYTLLAPTWKAVDVLIWITEDSTKCSTIHRKLGLKHEGDLPDQLIDEDIIIIDESSMMALPLFYSLLNWVPNLSWEKNKKIVLVWDDNQLLPIWLWRVFVDLIISWLVPSVRLFQIYRQKEDSLILENSKKVIEYSKDLVPKEKNLLTLDRVTSDWITYNTKDLEDSQVKDLVLNTIIENGWNEKTDVILTAQYKWDCWITELNQAMQRYLNQNNFNFFKWGFHQYYLWDRVMHVNENWYREDTKVPEKEVYPINMITNKENYNLLLEITEKYSTQDREELIDKNWILDCIWRDVVYNWRTQSIEVNWLVVANYKDWRIKLVKNPNISKKTWTVDKNVYNWNWGIVVGVKTQDWWVWLNTQTDQAERLRVSKITVPETKDKEEYVLIVDFWDKVVAYSQDRLEKISLFYAASVHKAQGSQFKKVYALCLPSSEFLLDKFWLYTELSRAQEQLFYYSTPEFTRRVQLKDSLESKRWIFKDYFAYVMTT